MTVKELINQLKTLDQNTLIKLHMESSYDGDCEYEDVYEVREKKYGGEKFYVIYT